MRPPAAIPALRHQQQWRSTILGVHAVPRVEESTADKLGGTPNDFPLSADERSAAFTRCLSTWVGIVSATEKLYHFTVFWGSWGIAAVPRYSRTD